MSDFVKESLFERIQHLLPEKKIADIFAGTGTIGLEAMSRGASTGIFIEQDPIAHELLKKNIAMLRIEPATFCWQTDVFRCSFRPRNVEALLPCDVVFLDPPYKLVERLIPGAPLFKSLERIARREFSSESALLVLRTPERAEFRVPDCWQPYEPLPQLSFSTMEIFLYQKQLRPDSSSTELEAISSVDAGRSTAEISTDNPATHGGL